MHYYIWIIDDKLAVAPMPSISDIPELSKIFDAVVVLIEPHEALGSIDYYIQQWTSMGVEVYYLPTPDFHPVELLDLYNVTKWIDEKIEEGKRVLIHCMGGVGRSGLVAAAYLVYTGKDLYHVVEEVSNRRPGALTNIGQRVMLEDYYYLIKNANLAVLDDLLKIIRKNTRIPYKHLSKTTQFTIELTQYLGLKLRPHLIYSSLLHCYEVPDASRIAEGCKIPKDEIGRIIDTLSDYNGEAESIEGILIRLTHILDLGMDGRIVILVYDKIGPVNYITALCSGVCTPQIRGAREYIDKLSRLVGEKIILDQASYHQYI